MGLNIGGFLKNAVGFAPYAQRALLEQQQRDDADKQRSLQQLYALNNDRRAEMASQLAQEQGAANILRTNAQTTKLGEPTPVGVTYKPDANGNTMGLPTKVIPGQGITPIATGVTAPPKPPASEPMLKTVGPDGRPIYTPRSQASGAAAPVTAPKTPSSEPVVKTVGPDGTVIYTPRGQAAGKAAPVTNPAGGSGALSGQTMQTLGRLGMSYNDLVQAIDQMDRYENAPGNLAKQTPFKQAMGAASEAHPSQEAHGLMGALNNAAGAFVGAKAQEKIGADDPEYRTYLNNKQRVATAFTELLPRPNQQLLQLEKGLSGADVGWNPELIRNIQGRRRGGLDVLKNILQQQGMLDANGTMTGAAPAHGGGRGAGPGTSGPPPNVAHPANRNDPGGPPTMGGPGSGAPTREQQLWDAAVAKHGKAKVLQEYGPRPGGDE